MGGAEGSTAGLLVGTTAAARAAEAAAATDTAWATGKFPSLLPLESVLAFAFAVAVALPFLLGLAAARWQVAW